MRFFYSLEDASCCSFMLIYCKKSIICSRQSYLIKLGMKNLPKKLWKCKLNIVIIFKPSSSEYQKHRNFILNFSEEFFPANIIVLLKQHNVIKFPFTLEMQEVLARDWSRERHWNGKVKLLLVLQKFCTSFFFAIIK